MPQDRRTLYLLFGIFKLRDDSGLAGREAPKRFVECAELRKLKCASILAILARENDTHIEAESARLHTNCVPGMNSPDKNPIQGV
jgi:hypothetical protein